MVGCVVPKCGYNSSNVKGQPKKSCHKIPDDPERRALYIRQINTLTGKPKKIRKGTKTITIDGQKVQDPSRANARICSSHFKSEWLTEKTSRNGKVTMVLHKDAYPIYKNQQEKDDVEKLLSNPSTQRAELPITPPAPNKSVTPPSEKIAVIPQSDGTISIRTRNKMVKLAPPTSTSNVPWYYDATNIAFQYPKDQGTNASGTTSTSEVPWHYYATNFAFQDQNFQSTSNASGTTSTVEVPDLYITSSTQSSSNVPEYYNATSFTENTLQDPKCQDTSNASGTTSTFAVTEFCHAKSFTENTFQDPKCQGTSNASGTTSIFMVPDFYTTSSAQSTSKVPEYYNATSFTENTLQDPKCQGTFSASGTTSMFMVPEYYNATSFTENTLQDPKCQGTSNATSTTSTVAVTEFCHAKGFTENTFQGPKCQGTSNVSGTTSTFEVPDFYTTSFAKNTSKVPEYYNATSFTENTLQDPKYQGTFNASGTTSMFMVPEYYNATSFTDDKGTFQDPKCQDTVDVSSGKSTFLPEHTLSYTISYVENGTRKMWRNEICMNKSACLAPEYTTFSDGTAMWNKTTSKQTLDSPPGDEVEFMNSTHAPVPIIQPVELPVVDQQKTLDDVLRQEEIEIENLRQKEMDAVVDNFLNNFIVNVHHDGSQDSLDDYFNSL